MDDTRGVLVVEVAAGSVASRFLQANDVILGLNDKQVNKLRDLLEARMSVIGANTGMVIFRNQKEEKKWVELGEKK
jgi:S1-C subfamily serine protease